MKTDYARAREEYQRSLALWQSAPVPQPFQVATQLYNLGQVAVGQGDMIRAMDLAKQVVEILTSVLGPDHPKVALAMGAVAADHSNLGEYAEARAVFEKALGILLRAVGPDHINVGRTQMGLGHALQALHDNARALVAYHEALRIFERDRSMLPLTAETLQGIANAQSDTGLLDEAFATNSKALLAFQEVFGPDQDQVAGILCSMGENLEALDRLKEASEYFTRARVMWEKVDGPDDFQIGIALTGLGHVEQRQGRTAQARASLERAVKQLEKYEGNPVFAALARFELAQVLWHDAGSHDRARSLAIQAEKALAGLGDAEPKELARVRAWLSQTATR
jgi:tetratricopeptide (TPR) repeat protein